MERAKRCNSCGKGLITTGSTTFPCPECGEPIGRCNQCREQSVKFECKCGYMGP